MRTPRGWWGDRRRERIERARTQGYADGVSNKPQRRVGMDGGRYQSAYDLAYGRGVMVARHRVSTDDAPGVGLPGTPTRCPKCGRPLYPRVPLDGRSHCFRCDLTVEPMRGRKRGT